MSVTPVPGPNRAVAVSGAPTVALPASLNGGLVVNPVLAVDQGVPTVETLFVDPTGAAPTLYAGGTTFALAPGQSWSAIPGQTTTTSVTSVTTGHKFSSVYW